ncbi:glutamate-gated chloride channel subunit beta-like [Bacillus rossius redtenbacheri]|uniref:glutamate-gated chloride channel subunit beta-like n=1 Tax=Bacillus rossius redtenbacheri TaxID=93214 RepID=UPI002FDE7117
MPTTQWLAALCQFLGLLALVETTFVKNFTLAEGYDIQYPPPGYVPFPIKIKAEVMHIINVRELDFVLSLDLVVRHIWTETRLQVGDSIKAGQRYLVRREKAGLFWKPQVHLRNLMGYEQAHGSEDISYLFVFPGGKLMVLERAYMDIRCDFDFQLYPLDVQTCMIEFLLPMSRSDEETLEWDDKRGGVTFYMQPAAKSSRLPKFRVQLVTCEENYTTFHAAGNVSSLRFWVILNRELANHMLETYIPTGLFVVVSWGSFLVNPEVVPGRMVLLVTNLLSLITLFESSRSTSPPCVGVKSMDVWFLACISLVVLALVEYCAILYQMKQGQETTTHTYCKLFTASAESGAALGVDRDLEASSDTQ